MGTSRQSGPIKTLCLQKIYQSLFDYFGPQHWWPAETPFEVMVGAILVQNTNWKNVACAIDRLKKEDLLFPEALQKTTETRLAKAIRPAGYFNVKTRRLKNFVDFFIKEYQGRVSVMRRQRGTRIRKKLLSVNGIGQETADSILLYALSKPFFVVDAYTRRVMVRHRYISPKDDYGAIQKIFTQRLPRDVYLYNEYHALLVRVSKEFCKKEPFCLHCPLNKFFKRT